jgi:hypothetical protein
MKNGGGVLFNCIKLAAIPLAFVVPSPVSACRDRDCASEVAITLGLSRFQARFVFGISTTSLHLESPFYPRMRRAAMEFLFSVSESSFVATPSGRRG